MRIHHLLRRCSIPIALAVIGLVFALFLRNYPGGEVDVSALPEDTVVLATFKSFSAPPSVIYISAKQEDAWFTVRRHTSEVCCDLSPDMQDTTIIAIYAYVREKNLALVSIVPFFSDKNVRGYTVLVSPKKPL